MKISTNIVRRDRHLAKKQYAEKGGGRQAWQADGPLLLLLGVMMLISLTTIYSASDGTISYVVRQAIYYGLAFAFLFLVANLEVYHFRRFAFPLYIFGIILLISVLLVGVEINGSQRWLDLGPINFQPAEYMKIVMPLALCWVLTYKPLPVTLPQLFYVLIITLIPAGLVFMQPDLGTTIIIVSTSVCLIFLAGIRLRFVLVSLVVLLSSLPLAWYYLLYDYHRARLATFLNPEADPLGAGWSLIQSKIAIGTGGVLGRGWNNNLQASLEFLPETHTDFIFSIYAEEHGLLGVLLLVFLYVCIILRCLYITRATRDSFERFFCSSLIFIFSVYVAINIGMVSGIMPVVGVPLPLVSYGGTALLTFFGAFGILMSVHNHNRKVV